MIFKIKNLFHYLIFSVFFTLIIMKSKFDIWDISIIEYRLTINGSTGMKIMSFSRGWIFQYYWVFVIRSLANILFINVEFKN